MYYVGMCDYHVLNRYSSGAMVERPHVASDYHSVASSVALSTLLQIYVLVG